MYRQRHEQGGTGMQQGEVGRWRGREKVMEWVKRERNGEVSMGEWSHIEEPLSESNVHLGWCHGEVPPARSGL